MLDTNSDPQFTVLLDDLEASGAQNSDITLILVLVVFTLAIWLTLTKILQTVTGVLNPYATSGNFRRQQGFATAGDFHRLQGFTTASDESRPRSQSKFPSRSSAFETTESHNIYARWRSHLCEVKVTL